MQPSRSLSMPRLSSTSSGKATSSEPAQAEEGPEAEELRNLRWLPVQHGDRLIRRRNRAKLAQEFRPRPHGHGDSAPRAVQGRQDSNLQPPVLETGALPVELRPY